MIGSTSETTTITQLIKDIKLGKSITLPVSKIPMGEQGQGFIDTLETSLGKELKGKISQCIPPVLRQTLEAASLTELTHFNADGQKELGFTLLWENTSWQLIPGIFTIKHPQIRFVYNNGAVTGTLGSALVIDGIAIDIVVEFPALLLRAQMQGGITPSAADLLQRFQLPKYFVEKQASSSTFQLSGLDILGDASSKRLLWHLALGDLPLYQDKNDSETQITLSSLQIQLDYQGGDKNAVTGMIWGEIDFGYAAKRHLRLGLLAVHPAPGAGWKFAGSIGLENLPVGDLVTQISNQLGVKGGPDLSQMIDTKLNVETLSVSYDTSTRVFEFLCALDFFSGKSDAEFILKVKMKPVGNEAQLDDKDDYNSRVPTAYEKTISAQIILTLGDEKMEFDAIFDDKPAKIDDSDLPKTTFAAAYQNLAGHPIDLGKLIKAVAGNDVDVSALDGFSVTLKDAFFLYQKTGAKTTSSENPSARLLFGLDWGLGLQLSKLPLVGKYFSAAQTLRVSFQPVYLHPVPQLAYHYVEKDWDPVIALFPGGNISLPSVNWESGKSLYLGMQVDLGGTKIPFTLSDANSPPLALDPTSSSPISVTAADTGIKWMDLQKSFGPVHLAKLGLKLTTQEIDFYLNGSLTAAGLSIALEGLRIGAKIKDLKERQFHPSFGLRGLGIDYKAGPLEIGGTFLHSTTGFPANVKEDYDGLAVISFKQLAIDAIGSYAIMEDGESSLFIYAMVNYPIGGPSFFFVTGLSAGFGYNRALVMPPIDQVKTFPLVANAINAQNSATGEKVDRSTQLQNQISSLRTSIPPKLGQYFVAAGIKFTTFKVVESFVLLAVSFGKELEIDLLGISSLVAPPQEKGIEPLVNMELGLKASFVPAKGTLQIRAQLTRNSYIFSKQCHLTGGFAFYSWFAPSKYQGDFVITVGGYHPKYKAPKHYPTVPRLGFNWQVTKELFLKGEAYFALPARALMAGGYLEATWDKGSSHAWFKVGADFIVSWQPYFYDAHFYVEVAATVTFHFFGTHRKTLSAGADVHIWGPDFSGTAKVHFWFITFSISFGSATPKPKPISWDKFKTSFLPKDPFTISLQKGLVKKQAPKAGATSDNPSIDLGIVNPSELEIVLESQIPLSQNPSFTAIAASEASPKAPPTIGVGSMDVARGGVTSSYTISDFKSYTISDFKKGSKELVSDSPHLSWSPVYKKAPAALWGGDLQPSVNAPSFIEDCLVVIKITSIQSKPLTGKPLRKASRKVDLNTTLAPKMGADPSVKQAVSNPLDELLTDPKITGRRDAILSSMGFEPSAINLPQNLASSFDDQPSILEYFSAKSNA